MRKISAYARKQRQCLAYPYTYTLMDELAASSTEPLPMDFRRHQLTRMWSGLSAIERLPAPTTDDWRVCSDAVNLMETLVVEMRVCEDASGLINDAVTALAVAGKRHRATGTIRMDAAGIQAVRAVLEDYAEVIDALPARTMMKCHRLTERRNHKIIQGKKQAHDVEVCGL